jgi:acetylornithine deacetylase/succinyl-diaminopimelate desuccinylase family protein
MTSINSDDLEALVRDLVGIPSENPPGDEGEVASFLAEQLADSPAGFDVEVTPVEEDRPNVVARTGDPDVGTLLLTGHTDIVPADAADWNGDPYRLRREDGRLVGRGTADMKGALAAKIRAAESYVEAGGTGEVVLAFVVGEENGGIGTAALVESGIDADGVIIGEPTDMTVAVAEKGVARFTITTRGENAHSGSPGAGVDAVEGMRAVLDEIERLESAAQERSHPHLEPETVTVTEIDGGLAPNVVADRVSATVDWRFLPTAGNDREFFEQVVRKRVAAATANAPYNADVEWFSFGRASETPADDLVVETVRAAATDVRSDAPLGGLNAITDARHFRLDLDVPTVVYGPGSIEHDAHTVDESVDQSDLLDTARVYHRAIEGFFAV